MIMNSENGMSCGCSRDMNDVIPNRYYNSQENGYQYILLDNSWDIT